MPDRSRKTFSPTPTTVHWGFFEGSLRPIGEVPIDQSQDPLANLVGCFHRPTHEGEESLAVFGRQAVAHAHRTKQVFGGHGALGARPNAGGIL